MTASANISPCLLVKEVIHVTYQLHIPPLKCAASMNPLGFSRKQDSPAIYRHVLRGRYLFGPAASASEYLEEIWKEAPVEEGGIDQPLLKCKRVCVCVSICDKQRGPAVSHRVLSDTLLIRQCLEERAEHLSTPPHTHTHITPPYPPALDDMLVGNPLCDCRSEEATV